MSNDHQVYLDLAQEQARKSEAENGVAQGAVLVKRTEIISESHDRTQQSNDPVAVAEMDCIRRAGRRTDYAELTLYTTAKPNMLVAGTMVQFGIGKLVIAGSPTQSPVLDFLREKKISVEFEEA